MNRQPLDPTSGDQASFIPACDVGLLYVAADADLGPALPLAPTAVLHALEAGEGVAFVGYPWEGVKLHDASRPQPTSQIGHITSLTDVFNGGLWASKRGAFTWRQLETTLLECGQHKDCMDFANAVAQPILNYVVLKLIDRRRNLTRCGDEPGSWAGSSHFEERNHVLYDRGRRLRYVHWAGQPLHPGGPYWELWKHYRQLGEGARPPLPGS